MRAEPLVGRQREQLRTADLSYVELGGSELPVGYRDGRSNGVEWQSSARSAYPMSSGASSSHHCHQPDDPGGLMWIIAGHMTVDDDKRDDFVEAHRHLVARARQAPGCLDVAITADPVASGRVNNYERWETWEALEEWRERAHAPDTGIEMRDVDVMAYEVNGSRPPF